MRFTPPALFRVHRGGLIICGNSGDSKGLSRGASKQPRGEMCGLLPTSRLRVDVAAEGKK